MVLEWRLQSGGVGGSPIFSSRHLPASDDDDVYTEGKSCQNAKSTYSRSLCINALLKVKQRRCVKIVPCVEL